MKRKLISALCLLLVALTLLTACSSHGKTLIKAGDEKISVNMFQLYLSRMKGSLKMAGEDVNNAAYWSKVVDLENGTTQAEEYTARVLEGLKQIAAAMIIYEEEGLTLDPKTEDDIDAWIDTLVEQVAGGSKTEMNSILSAFGANLTVLRDSAIIEAKLEQLKLHLYGTNGSQILSSEKDKFFRQAYYRGKQLYFSSEYHSHDKDADGRTVYYKLAAGTEGGLLAEIAYDTEKGTLCVENGANVYREFGGTAYDTVNGKATGKRDERGDLIYYVKNGDEATEEIAYQTTDTEERKVRFDEEEGVYRWWVIAYDERPSVSAPSYHYTENASGEKVAKKVKYTDDEMAKRKLAADEIIAASKDNEALFDEFCAEYSDSLAFDEAFAPNGMFFAYGAVHTDPLFSSFSATLLELEEGELKILPLSDGGFYVLMRCELEEDYAAFEDEENSTWFESFGSLVTEYALQNKTAAYLDRLKIDEDLLEGVDITTVSPNTVY